MKIYKDIDEVMKPTEVPRELWKYENEMKKKPKFDHITDSGKKVDKKGKDKYENKMY